MGFNKNNIKRILLKFLKPGRIFACIFIPAVDALLILTFALGFEKTPLAYTVCFLFVYGIAMSAAYASSIFKSVKSSLMKISLFRRLIKDKSLQNSINLATGLIVSAFYGTFKLLAGRYFKSYWMTAIGAYYLVLAALRFILFNALRRDNSDEVFQRRICRNVGILMLLLNLVMSVIILMMVRDNRSYRYPGIIIYVIAAHAIYKILLAAWRVIRRGWENPIMGALRRLKLTEAMMSVLALQTALLARFGGDSIAHQFANAVTGSLVCIDVFILSIRTILSCKD